MTVEPTIDQLKIWDIISGEIRYFDKYYSDNDGLIKVKNRIERLEELVIFVKNNLGYGATIINVDIGLMSTLFPEVYNFKKLKKENKLPEVFYIMNLKHQEIIANDIIWRLDYTKSVFPENLWDLRNSGTMYKDVQEAPSIFKTLYNLDAYINKEEIILNQIEPR